MAGRRSWSRALAAISTSTTALTPAYDAVAVRARAARSTADEVLDGDNYARNVLAVGAGKNVLDMGRTALKVPEAARAGRLMPALAQAALGAPTTAIIDPNAPLRATVASAGRSFTRVDAFAYRSASLVGASLGAFQLANGVPNIYRAVRQGGAAAIAGTEIGRSGALQVFGGGLSTGMLGRAAVMAGAAGVRGAIPLTMAAAGSASLAAPWLVGVTLGTSALVLANQHGFLDFMDKDETRTFSQVQRDSWEATGISEKAAAAREAITRRARELRPGELRPGVDTAVA